MLVLYFYRVTEKQLLLEFVVRESFRGMFSKMLVNLKECLITVSENACSSSNETRNVQLQRILQSA